MLVVANLFNKLFGKQNKKIEPRIIPIEEHNLKNSLIDFNALKIINRLRRFGFDAYIVGGAVRDCLLGHKPKDFDVVTNATPKEIKKIFTNGRIIGRRFKLVHIIFANTYIEVATFRSSDNGKKEIDPFTKENNFGTIEEDVLRRDFSVNALYYDPEEQKIIDYVGGFEDIKSRVIRPLNPPEISFLEDPVRMLRAVKYKAMLDCKIDENVVKKIKKHSKELANASPARLYEEINKILRSGRSKEIFIALYETDLLKYLIPFLFDDLSGEKKDIILSYIEKFDNFMSDNKVLEYDVFWGLILYQRLLNENLDNKDFTYIHKVNEFFLNYLSVLKAPNKTSDLLSKAFYLFYKLQDKSSQYNLKRFLNHRYFPESMQLLKLLSPDEDVIKFWELNRNKNKNIKRKKVKIKRDNITSEGFKRVLTTKNYTEKKSVNENIVAKTE